MLNIRAFCCAHIPIDKNAKPIDEEAEEDEPLTEEERKTALLVLKRQSDAECEYEVVFKQCINNKYVLLVSLGDPLDRTHSSWLQASIQFNVG